MQTPIDHYIAELARRLFLTEVERSEALADVRAQLAQRVAPLRASGVPEVEAQRQAVQAFGSVRHVSRRLNAAYLSTWGPMRWARGIVIGAVVMWALWTIGSAPVAIAYLRTDPVTSSAPSSPSMAQLGSAFIQASPLASGAFYAFLTLGWLWLAPLLALYLVLPFMWGQRAKNWWSPGLAYGLGAWLSAPWFVIELANVDWAWAAEGRTVAVALVLSVVASLAGWQWRQSGTIQVQQARTARFT